MLKDLKVVRNIHPLEILSGKMQAGHCNASRNKKSKLQRKCLNSLWGRINIEWIFSQTYNKRDNYRLEKGFICGATNIIWHILFVDEIKGKKKRQSI